MNLPAKPGKIQSGGSIMDAKTIPPKSHNIIDLASQAILLANNRSVEQIEKLIMALREFIKPSSTKSITSELNEQQVSKDNEYLYHRMLKVGHLDDLLAKAILTALHGNRPIGQISKLLKALQNFKDAPSPKKVMCFEPPHTRPDICGNRPRTPWWQCF